MNTPSAVDHDVQVAKTIHLHAVAGVYHHGCACVLDNGRTEKCHQWFKQGVVIEACLMNTFLGVVDASLALAGITDQAPGDGQRLGRQFADLSDGHQVKADDFHRGL